MVRFYLGPLLQGQTRVAKLKNAYNSLIIAPTGLGCENIPDFALFQLKSTNRGEIFYLRRFARNIYNNENISFIFKN